MKLWFNEDILRLVIENLSLLINGDIDIVLDRLQEYSHTISIEEVIENIDKTHELILRHFPDYNGEELIMGIMQENKNASISYKGD